MPRAPSYGPGSVPCLACLLAQCLGRVQATLPGSIAVPAQCNNRRSAGRAWTLRSEASHAILLFSSSPLAHTALAARRFFDDGDYGRAHP